MSNRPIVISLSPNVELDDMRLAASLITKPSHYQTGDALEKLSDQLQQYFPNGRTFLTNSGRSALYVAIKSLHLQPNDEVLMQAYTCNAVPNPVLWADGLPRFVDIDKNTLNMSMQSLQANITERSKVIIVQHTFGYPAPMEEIMQLARTHNLIVIEDCAHALGARIQNTTVGSFGDMAIFSFGRDKIISSVYGGCLVVNAPQRIDAAANEYEHLDYPSRRWTLQQLLHPIIFSFGLRYYYTAEIGKTFLEIMKRMHWISRAVTKGEKQGKRPRYFPARLPNALAALASQQLEKLDRFQAHRTAIAEYYNDHLDTTHIHIAQVEDISTGIVEPAYLRYTVLVANPAELLTYAKQRGIMLGDWYNAAITPPGTDETAMHYVTGTCPSAEDVAKQSVNLPTHINISKRDAVRIVSVINSFYHEA